MMLYQYRTGTDIEKNCTKQLLNKYDRDLGRFVLFVLPPLSCFCFDHVLESSSATAIDQTPSDGLAECTDK